MTASAPTELQSGRVVVVTGMSGAGKSTALHALEDLGFFCIDNLPPAVVEQAVEACEEDDILDVALGLHVRVHSFLERAAEVIERMSRGPRKPPVAPPSQPGLDLPIEQTPPPGPVERAPSRRVVVLFLDAADEVLIRRFSETRRPHPLAPRASDETVGPILDGIQLERERLAPLRELASVVLDTSHLTVHQLRREVMQVLGPQQRPHMQTRVTSFGFKYGLPADASVVLDVRYLDNPYFVPELRPQSGLDAPVRDFVLAAPDAGGFLDRAEEMLAFAMPRHEREGKSYLTVAVGCTGGQHRSVALAEALAARLRARTGMEIKATHRDLTRSGRQPAGGNA